MESTEEIYGFYGHMNALSNFFEAKIMVDGCTYNCVEQYYQWAKAKYFQDINQAEKIMSTKDPAQQKRLGNLIHGYKEGEWATQRDQIMWKALQAKYSQSRWCQKSLLSTWPKRICEASPYDTYWSCGLARFDWRVDIPKFWRGENRLGQMLEEIREKLQCDPKLLL
jgi:ribA/ribD-fused uncharacterized protein